MVGTCHFIDVFAHFEPAKNRSNSQFTECACDRERKEIWGNKCTHPSPMQTFYAPANSCLTDSNAACEGDNSTMRSIAR